MGEFLRNHWRYLLAALLLHVLFGGLFALTMVTVSREAPPARLAIEAVVVDPSTLAGVSRAREQEREREEAAARERAAAERRREQEAVAQREAQERAVREREAEQERRREAEDQRRKQEAEQQRVQQEADRKRRAEEERKRLEDIERKQKEEAERRRAAEEARAQSAREDELRRQLEAEEGRMQAANSGLLNQYVAMIEQRIVRNWNRPPSARPGLECEVRVAQSPGGTVLTVQLGRCNGDAAVRQSIEAAVMRSSPLPPPPDPRLFERNLVLIFRPAE